MKKYTFYSNCIPVVGSTQVVIYDLYRMRYRQISLKLFDILSANENKPMIAVEKELGSDFNDFISVLKKLVNEDYLFFSDFDMPLLFPKFNEDYVTASFFTNAVLFVDSSSSYRFDLAFKKLNSLGVYNYHCVFDASVDVEKLFSLLLPFLDGMKAESIDVTIRGDLFVTKDLLIVLEKIKIISNVFAASFHGRKDLHMGSFIDFVRTDSVRFMEFVSTQGRFRVNPPFFVEARQFNVFYNKKIIINENGDIQNYL